MAEATFIVLVLGLAVCVGFVTAECYNMTFLSKRQYEELG
jgi:hypothetical protein